MSSVASIIGKSIAGKELAQDGGYGNGACSEHTMHMVRNQGPCIARGSRFRECDTQTVQKIIPVGIGLKYFFTLNAPNNDMMHGLRGINAFYSKNIAKEVLCQFTILWMSQFLQSLSGLSSQEGCKDSN